MFHTLPKRIQSNFFMSIAYTCMQMVYCVGSMQGLFNFKPSVRPVPLEAHIQGYPGKFYCPRMASMNKPAYAAIQVGHRVPSRPVWQAGTID